MPFFVTFLRSFFYFKAEKIFSKNLFSCVFAILEPFFCIKNVLFLDFFIYLKKNNDFSGMKHLLIGISPEDMDQLNKFMIANGITENAANSATSPLLTAETSLTTEDGSLGCDNIRFVFSAH